MHTKLVGERLPGLWGRVWQANIMNALGNLSIILVTPCIVFYFYIAAFFFNCSLVVPIQELLAGRFGWAQLHASLPQFSWNAAYIVAIWLSLQLALACLPDYLHKIYRGYRGGYLLGSVTPAGNRLWYNINGLQAWFISHLLFIAGAFYYHWFSATTLFDNWGGILLIANGLGFFVALYAYIKAYLFPSHPDDRKFSGSRIYDFYMGIELNPRMGPIDFKLFFNGRPGIVAWTLINLSFAAAQYQRYGHVTNSMLLVNLLHGLYVLYFFWKEKWYLNTIDISHDHFGWMLAWGDCVWLPYMYTLQGLFLVFNPVELSTPYALFVLALGLIGFAIFLSANNQKDLFRRTEGNAQIWGKAAEYIPCQYTTAEGLVRESKLLVTGWWGIARHMNYTGDLLLSLAYSLACGVTHLFPYFYFFFLLILLVHRCIRDEHRCYHKYGLDWQRYCERVPYRLIPGIF